MRSRAIGGGGGGQAAGAVGRASAGGARVAGGRVAGVGAGFSLGLAGTGAAPGGTAQGAGAAPAAGVAPMALFALQEGGEDRQGYPQLPAPARDEAARQGAEAMLDELQELQRALLGAGLAPALERLAARLGALEEAADPGLREAVRAVALRAEIELARRGWAGSASGR
jgi:hypothetical protein